MTNPVTGAVQREHPATAPFVVHPGPGDTGAMGHISNTVLPLWFQDARKALVRSLAQGAEPGWHTVVARYEVDLKRQMFPGAPVAIHTTVESLGTSSIRFFQEAWQQGQLAATGRTVLVHFDEATQRSSPLPPAMRACLAALVTELDHQPAEQAGG